MAVVNVRWRHKEQDSRRGSEREMYGSTHRLGQNDRWGDYGAGLHSTVIKVREPPRTAQVDSRPITLVEWVKIRGAGNTLHFNAIFHSIGQNSLLTSLHCKAMHQLSFPFVEKELFFWQREAFFILPLEMHLLEAVSGQSLQFFSRQFFFSFSFSVSGFTRKKLTSL